MHKPVTRIVRRSFIGDSALPDVSVRARSIRVRAAPRSNTSRQIPKDTKDGVASVGRLVPITTPYDVRKLDTVIEQSNILRQCIDAYVVNIASGFDVVPVHKSVAVDENERAALESFLEYANSDNSLQTEHQGVVADYEERGRAFLEYIRDAKGRLVIVRRADAGDMYLLPKHPEPQKIVYDIARGPRTVQVVEYKRFRAFVQEINGHKVYFREFGDPRRMSRSTGEYEDGTYIVQPGDEATELLHIKARSNEPYGVPRWVGQLPSLLGSREAEEVNLRYFEDNTVPPMMITVAGGRLTNESFRELKRLLNSQGLGKDRQNQVLLIEAVPERDSLEDKGTVTLKVDKLTDARQSDGLFKDYDEANQAKVLSSFRLAPINIGRSADQNYATAQTSMYVAESQVYAPERRRYDEVLNKFLVSHPDGLGLRTVRLRSKPPVITDPASVVKSMTALNVMGGVTPRTARDALRTLLQLDVDPLPASGEDGYEEWMDTPMPMILKSNSEGGQVNTDSEQGGKSPIEKDVEAGGDVTPTPPEHGSE